MLAKQGNNQSIHTYRMQQQKNSLFCVVEHTNRFGLCYSMVVSLVYNLKQNKMKTLKENLVVIISMGSALIVTLILSLFFGWQLKDIDGSKIIFTLMFSILFVSLPILLIWSYCEFNN